MKNIQLIGASSGWGSPKRGCEDGPQKIFDHIPLSQWLQQGHRIALENIFSLLHSKEKILSMQECLPYIIKHSHQLSLATYQSMIKKIFPVIFGGDHSVAIGSWHGICKAIREQHAKPLGLIWIDAHKDSHTPETTPSQAWHGMPLAALLGHGLSDFTHYDGHSPAFLPQHVCLIGVRSYEEGEAQLLSKLGVRVYYMEEVEKRGLKIIFQEALERVLHNTAGFGISLDLDVFDPIEAPGVGTPADKGIQPQELLHHFPIIQAHSALRALEIVEYNPYLDQENKTLNIVYQLLNRAFSTMKCNK